MRKTVYEIQVAVSNEKEFSRFMDIIRLIVECLNGVSIVGGGEVE